MQFLYILYSSYSYIAKMFKRITIFRKIAVPNIWQFSLRIKIMHRRLLQLKHVFYFAALLCCLTYTIPFSRAEANDTTLYFDLGSEDGWVPYRTGDEIGEQGVLADLAQLLEMYSTINFTSVNLPMRRAERALIDGIVDFDFICREWFPNGEIGEQFVASDQLFEVNEYVVTLKGNSELFPTLAHIHGKRIGTIGGYFYFDDAKFTRVDFLDENKLIKGLKHGRFQAIILEGETAKHWARLNSVEIAFAALHSKGHLVIRLNKKHKALVPEINATIARIKESGELSKILHNHKITL